MVSLAAAGDVQRVQRSKHGHQVGCEVCPLNGDAHKFTDIDNDVRGRAVMVWIVAPGTRDDSTGKLLSGSSGKLLCTEFERFVIHRNECDIQAVVRCRPTNYDGDGRQPNEKELHCCRKWTRRAIRKQSARVHFVLGDIAARQLLGTEYRKDRVTLWSEKLQAMVVIASNPGHLLHSATIESRREFRRSVRAVSVLQKCKGRFGIVKHYDYGELRSAKEFRAYLQQLKRSGERVAVDIEDVRKGHKTRVLCVAFCAKPGHARVVFIDHPKRPVAPKERKLRVRVLREFMQDATVEKIFHHGNHDVMGLRDGLKVKTNGYTYDTEYAAYMANPNQRKYGLDNLSNNWVPEFGGYKKLPYQFLKEGDYNFGHVPPAVLGRYNCADVDLSKRVEIITRKQVNMALLKVFIDCGFMVDKMQDDGPQFDYNFYEWVQTYLPVMIKALRETIRAKVGDRRFNPGSPVEVAKLIYGKLGHPPYIDPKTKKPSRTTSSKALEQIKKTNSVIEDILRYRELTKLEGTYLKGFKNSADLHNGAVYTKWWLTGTITGRLRSGGGNEPGVVNLQNIANDPEVQNLLISDDRWRLLEKAVRAGETTVNILKSYGDMNVFLALDYSGIEVRVLAEITQDPVLLDLFKKGFDIHSLVGEELTGIPAAKIKKDKKTRVMIKGFHFGLIYGQKPPQMYEAMAENFTKMGIPKKEWPSVADLTEFQAKYFKKFKQVAVYIDRMHRQAEEYGYVETMFGFRRPVDVGDDGGDRGTYWANQAINCVDYQTEILTQRGWLNGKNLVKTDLILTKNRDTGAMEWQHPISINHHGGRHKMIRWQSKSFSSCTTGNHRWLVYDKGLGRDRVITTDTMSRHGDHRIHRTGCSIVGTSGLNLTNSELALLGMVLTDGYYVRDSKQQIVITQTKPKMVEWLKTLLTKVGSNSNYRGSHFSFSDDTSKTFRTLCPGKSLTSDLLCRLTTPQARRLVVAMLRGDGTRDKDTGRKSFCAGVHKIDADMFQALCTVAGVATSVHKCDPINSHKAKALGIHATKLTYKVTLLRRDKAQVTRRIENNKRVENGVWCPTVPNGFWFARRMGTTYVTGNSPIQGSAHQLLLMCIAILRNKAKTYSLLQNMTLEVHDSIYFRVPLNQLEAAYAQAKQVMEVDVAKYIKEHFGRVLEVPLVSEGEAGLRLGAMVADEDIDGENPRLTVHEFLPLWIEKMDKSNEQLEEKYGDIKAA